MTSVIATKSINPAFCSQCWPVLPWDYHRIQMSSDKCVIVKNSNTIEEKDVYKIHPRTLPLQPVKIERRICLLNLVKKQVNQAYPRPRNTNSLWTLQKINATLILSMIEFKHVCTHSDCYDSQKGFDNLTESYDVQVKNASPRPLVDFDFVKGLLAFIAKPVEDVSGWVGNSRSKLMKQDLPPVVTDTGQYIQLHI